MNPILTDYYNHSYVYQYGERVTICHASLSTGIRRDRAGNTFAAVSQKFSSIIVSVVALFFGLFGILVLREAIFTHEVKSTKMQNNGSSTWTTESLKPSTELFLLGCFPTYTILLVVFSVYLFSSTTGLQGQCEE